MELLQVLPLRVRGFRINGKEGVVYTHRSFKMRAPPLDQLWQLIGWFYGMSTLEWFNINVSIFLAIYMVLSN